MESACETCAYFRTGTEFLPILVRRRDHARSHGRAGRAALLDGLIQRRAAVASAEPARAVRWLSQGGLRRDTVEAGGRHAQISCGREPDPAGRRVAP
jgi:hypothetical protein